MTVALTQHNTQVERARQQFVSQVHAIAGDVRLLWLPRDDETTTSVDRGPSSRTVTYDASVANRLAERGFGHAVSFNGTSQYASVPDAADLSFGDGSDDSPFSVVALAKVTDTAASRVFATKYNASGAAREWEFRLTAADALFFGFYDESVDVAPLRVSSAAVPQGRWVLYGGVYTAATGGATAGNDISLYVDGQAVASAATNQASYVAMENTAAPVKIGAHGNASIGSNFLPGDMAMVLVTGEALTAAKMWALYQLCDWYFDFLA